MAIAFVQKTPNTTAPNTSGTSGTTIATTAFGSDVAEGDLLVAVAGFYHNGDINPTTVFSDNKGNTWYTDKYKNQSGAESFGTVIGHCIVAAGKGGSGLIVTATFSVAALQRSIGAIEYSGVDQTIGQGGSANNGATGYSANPSPGQVTASGNHVYVGGLGWYADYTCTEPSGWTERHFQTPATYNAQSTIEKIDAGNQTPTWTMAENHWAAVVVAYKEAAAGGLSIPVAMDNYRRLRS